MARRAERAVSERIQHAAATTIATTARTPNASRGLHPASIAETMVSALSARGTERRAPIHSDAFFWREARTAADSGTA